MGVGRPAVVFQMPDTVLGYITRDDRPNILPASSQHGAKRRGGLSSYKLI